MPEDIAGISTVIRMLADIERKLNFPRDDVRVLEERVVQLVEKLENHITYSEMAGTKAEESVMKTEKELSKRLDGMNEFREALADQSKSYMTIQTYDANHKMLEVKIEAIQKIVWGGLAIMSFLMFAIPLVLHFVA